MNFTLAPGAWLVGSDSLTSLLFRIAHWGDTMVLVDPDTLSDDERRRRGIRRLPTSLGEALDALERDDILRAALGETLAKEYLTVKRSEVRGFDGKDVAFEIEQHFYKF